MNKTKIQKDIGNELYFLRINKEYSRKQLSIKTGLSINSIASIENGQFMPKIDTLLKILYVYEITLSDFSKKLGI